MVDVLDGARKIVPDACENGACRVNLLGQMLICFNEGGEDFGAGLGQAVRNGDHLTSCAGEEGATAPCAPNGFFHELASGKVLQVFNGLPGCFV